MKQITLEDYFAGRQIKYSKELTNDIRQNAAYTVDCTNKLLRYMQEDGLNVNFTKVNSGWRPVSVNSATPGADPNSCHLTSEAIDLGDPNGVLKKWVGENPNKVKLSGFLITEDFSITKTWLHLQTRYPLSWQKGKVLWIAGEDHWKNNYSKNTVEILTC
jgi:hypothetical protein